MISFAVSTPAGEIITTPDGSQTTLGFSTLYQTFSCNSNGSCIATSTDRPGLGGQIPYSYLTNGATPNGVSYSASFQSIGSVLPDGSLGLAATIGASITDLGTLNASGFEAYVASYDDLVINSSKLTGQTGTAHVWVNVGGSISASAGPAGVCIYNLPGVNTACDPTLNDIFTGSVSASYFWALLKPGCIANCLLNSPGVSDGTFDVTKPGPFNFSFGFTYDQPFSVVTRSFYQR